MNLWNRASLVTLFQMECTVLRQRKMPCCAGSTAGSTRAIHRASLDRVVKGGRARAGAGGDSGHKKAEVVHIALCSDLFKGCDPEMRTAARALASAAVQWAGDDCVSNVRALLSRLIPHPESHAESLSAVHSSTGISHVSNGLSELTGRRSESCDRGQWARPGGTGCRCRC